MLEYSVGGFVPLVHGQGKKSETNGVLGPNCKEKHFIQGDWIVVNWVVDTCASFLVVRKKDTTVQQIVDSISIITSWAQAF